MELYFAYPSTYSLKVLLALYEKELTFTPKLVDLGDEQARQQYAELYPVGKIPLLVRDDGRLLPESSIIIEYLDDEFPDTTRLIPADTQLARRVRLIDRMCDLYLNDPVVQMIYASLTTDSSQNQDILSRSSNLIGTLYRFLDGQLADRTFIAGDHFTMADCAAIPGLYYARSFADFSIFKHIGRYWDSIQDYPSWQKVHAEAAPYINAILGDEVPA